MRTKEFIDLNCKGSRCTHFDMGWGCNAFAGEECYAAFCHPHWHGKSMVERVDEYCEAKRAEDNKDSKKEV